MEPGYVGNPPSSSQYVAARIDGKLTKILKAAKTRCDHVFRICERCCSDWGADYELYLERTAYGRWLATHKED